jgi:hypothetical protein
MYIKFFFDRDIEFIVDSALGLGVYLFCRMYVCKDNHLLNWCIDIYCSRTLYTSELEVLKLAGQ